jgi:hypothetical protein
VDWIYLAQTVPVASPYEHDNEASVTKKFGEFVDQLEHHN